MTDDERAIRGVVDEWMKASRAGDTQKVLSLMTDDVVFMVPGAEPFGKDAFAAASQDMKDMRIDGEAKVREVKVLGNWAFLRTRLDMTVTPPGSPPVRRSGYAMTIMRKEGDGKWRLARDANLVMTEANDSSA